MAQKTESILSLDVWRNLVLERDGFACRRCPSRDDLHVHHIKQEALFPELRRAVENGLTPCGPCHRKVSHQLCGPSKPIPFVAVAGEEWRDVVGYEGVYSVSNVGRVRRDKAATCTQAGRLLKPSAHPFGYVCVVLSAGDQRKDCMAHVLVAAAFIGPRPDGMVINHIDSDPANNRPDNLEYVTQAENIAHSGRLGRRATGDRSGSRLHPERLARGDRHSSRTHPERLARGERHGSVTHPERVARGERHSSVTHPERVARGDRNGARTHPEKLPRGDQHWARRHPEKYQRGDAHHSKTRPETVNRGERVATAKVTRVDVVAIRESTLDRKILAAQYGVSPTQISNIRNRTSWKHVA